MKKSLMIRFSLIILINNFVVSPTTLASEDSPLSSDQFNLSEQNNSIYLKDNESKTNYSNKQSYSLEEKKESLSKSTIKSNWGTSNVIFDTESKTLTVSQGTIDNQVNPFGTDFFPWEAKHIILEAGVMAPEDSSNLFSSHSGDTLHFTFLESITGNLDTSKVINMSYMCNLAPSITELDVSNWDVSNVTDMSSMFASVRGIKDLDVSHWDTSKVTNMNHMFDFTFFSKLDLNNWNTSNVTNMEGMFGYTVGLKNLKISDWNTGNVTNMSKMFYLSSALTELDISSWDTRSVENMANMFSFTNNLQKLVLGNYSLFNSSVDLPEPDITSKNYLGSWERIDPAMPRVVYKNSNDFMTNYDGLLPGIYVWQQKLDSITVEFNSNGGSSIPTQSVLENETATKPTDPIRSGYTFDGWYNDQALSLPFDFNTPITQPLILYAKWTELSLPINEYLIEFNSNGGSFIPTQSVLENETATKPTDPIRSGYTFDGWYNDQALSLPFDFNTPITQPLILYAKWVKKDPLQESNAINTSNSITHINKDKLIAAGEKNNVILYFIGILLILIVIFIKLLS